MNVSARIPPLRGSKLNLTHPLTRGLTFCWVADNYGKFAHDYARRVQLPTTNPDRSANKESGPAWVGVANTYAAGSPAPYVWTNAETEGAFDAGLNPFSIFTIFRTITNTTAHRGIAAKDDYVSAWALYIAATTGTFRFAHNNDFASLGGVRDIADGNWHTGAVTRDLNDFGATYVDGVVDDTEVGFNDNITDAGDFYIADSAATPAEMSGAIKAFMFWKDRSLSAADVLSLHIHPWQMFESLASMRACSPDVTNKSRGPTRGLRHGNR